MNIKLTTREVFYFIFSFGLLLITICNGVINYHINMYLLCIVFVWLISLTFQYKNFSIYQLFLFTYFFFLLSRIFLNIIGVYDMRTLSLYQRNTMTDDVANETLRSLLSFLIGTSYAWLFSNKNNKKINVHNHVVKPIFSKWIEYLYYIYIVLFTFKLYYIIKVVRVSGYLSIFNGTVSNINFPIIFSGAATITETLFIILMYFNRDVKSFKKYCALLMFAGIVKMFTGQRAYALVLLLYILFLWSYHFKEIHIANIRIVALALVIPIIIQITWNYRYHVNQSISEIFSNNIYFQVLEAQGSSLEVIADVISYSDRFSNKFPFFLGYVVDFFQIEPAGQVIEDIKYGNYLSDHLTYTLNPGTFYAGHGTGTSIVAEGYDLFNGNMFFLFLFGMIISLIAFLLSQRMYKNIYWFALSFYYLKDFILSPRDTVLKNAANILFAFLVCFVVNEIDKSIRKKHNMGRCLSKYNMAIHQNNN